MKRLLHLLQSMSVRQICTVIAAIILLPACSGKLFEGTCDVGSCKLPGKMVYNKDSGVYTLTGAGTNMWGKKDEFFMVWKKMTGNFIISAKVAFEGKGVNPHRKMGLIIRESLEPDAKYSDLAVHGDGLTSLQFRYHKGDITDEMSLGHIHADHLEVERTADAIIVRAGIGEYYEHPSAVLSIKMPETCYVGLFICSHEADILETCYFSDVLLREVRW